MLRSFKSTIYLTLMLCVYNCGTKVSNTKIAIRNSLILDLTLRIPEKTDNKDIKVVSITNKIEIPSTPN